MELLILLQMRHAREVRTIVTQDDRTPLAMHWPWWRCVLTGLSILALTMSVYLSWHYLVGGPVIGCGGGSPCDQVLGSRWSTIAGVLPVSGLAAGTFLAILVASLFIGPNTAAPVRRLAWDVMLTLVGAAAGSAVWFTIVQQWVIGAFCPYCMATHITALLLTALVTWRAPLQFDDESTDVALANLGPAGDSSPIAGRSILGRLHQIGLALAGLCLAGILAVCQVAFTPPAVSRGGEALDNLLAVDSHTVPLLGSSDAPYIVTLLFDYECPHCQQLHFMLDEAIHRFDGKLAFALCPAPLNSQCNPYVPRDVDQFKNACELAKVGLAVWVAKREMFPAFQRWMFSFESGDRWQPRSLDAARAKAIELVGQAKFDAAQVDPWIGRHMQDSIRLYGDTGGNAVPKLVFRSRWVLPKPNDVDDLILILQDSLAVPIP